MFTDPVCVYSKASGVFLIGVPIGVDDVGTVEWTPMEVESKQITFGISSQSEKVQKRLGAFLAYFEVNREDPSWYWIVVMKIRREKYCFD